MILTYKVRHGRDFSEELRMAKQVADHVVRHRTFTSKDVKHIGLKSMIANQILRKYGRSKTIKKARNVNLIVPSQGINVDHNEKTIAVPCLKMVLSYRFPAFEKVNQIEVDGEYVHISVSVIEELLVEPTKYIGVDLNATGHAVIVGNPKPARYGSSANSASISTKSTRTAEGRSKDSGSTAWSRRLRTGKAVLSKISTTR